MSSFITQSIVLDLFLLLHYHKLLYCACKYLIRAQKFHCMHIAYDMFEKGLQFLIS
jgi:hypothetical protein